MNARQQKIVALLQQTQEVSVQDLSEMLDVSTMTIRRDLAYLERQRALTRTHGGAINSKPAVIEFSFLARSRERTAEKAAIARQVAAHIVPGMTLVLDTGTTTLEVARALLKIPRLRVLTSSLAVASALYAQENIELILLGGCVRQNSPDLSGPLTEDNLRVLRSDAAIIGADAADVHGLYTADINVSRVSQAIIANAQETWLVLDSAKFQRRAFARFTDWRAIHHVVTDDDLSPADRDWLTAAVPDVQIVPAGSAAGHPQLP